MIFWQFWRAMRPDPRTGGSICTEIDTTTPAYTRGQCDQTDSSLSVISSRLFPDNRRPTSQESSGSVSRCPPLNP